MITLTRKHYYTVCVDNQYFNSSGALVLEMYRATSYTERRVASMNIDRSWNWLKFRLETWDEATRRTRIALIKRRRSAIKKKILISRLNRSIGGYTDV